jgi:hypothetical protein
MIPFWVFLLWMGIATACASLWGLVFFAVGCPVWITFVLMAIIFVVSMLFLCMMPIAHKGER